MRPSPLPHPRFLAETPLKAAEDRSNDFVHGPFAEIYHHPGRYQDVLRAARTELEGEGWTPVPGRRPSTDHRAEWRRRNARGLREIVAIRDKREFEAAAKRGDGKPGVIVLVSREEVPRSLIGRLASFGPKILVEPAEP